MWPVFPMLMHVTVVAMRFDCSTGGQYGDTVRNLIGFALYIY